MERFQDIKNLIREISATKGLSFAESIFVIEKAMENVFYGRYRAVFYDSYDLYAENDDEKIPISSLKDIKNIRHKIFLEAINGKKEYINNLKDGISLKEIVSEINKEVNNLSVSKNYAKYKNLINRHVRGEVISKTEEYYIVNIGVGKAAYLQLSEGYYETFKKYPFFVKNVVRDLDEGFVRIFLSKPIAKTKPVRSGKKLTEIFKDGKTGKVVKNKKAVRVTDNFVWVFDTRHRETLYRKEFTQGDNLTRGIALSEAESFFGQL